MTAIALSIVAIAIAFYSMIVQYISDRRLNDRIRELEQRPLRRVPADRRET